MEKPEKKRRLSSATYSNQLLRDFKTGQYNKAFT
jgi:hypothetical protein